MSRKLADGYREARSGEAMKVELKPEHQELIDRAIQSGAFRDVDDVLDQAFASIVEKVDEEDWLMRDREYVAAKLARGFEQSERGELIGEEDVEETLDRRWEERERSAGR
jgi:Arc/MetJ-type ribon-helix-helix transcriptional regulator